MKNNKLRLLSIILALCLLISLAPVTQVSAWTQETEGASLYAPDFADATAGALAPGWALSAKNSVWDTSRGEMTYGTGKGNLELSYNGNMAVYMHTGSSTQCYTSYPGMYYQLDNTQDAMVLSYDLTASGSVRLLNILMPSYLNAETGAFTDLPLTMSFDAGAFTVTWDGEELVSGETIMTTNVAKNFKIVAYANPVAEGKEIGFALYLNGEYKCGGTKLVSSFPGFNAIRVWHKLGENSKYALSNLKVDAFDISGVSLYNLDNPPSKEGYVVDTLYQDPLQTVVNTAESGYAFVTWKQDASILYAPDFADATAGALAPGWALSAKNSVWDTSRGEMTYGTGKGNLELSYNGNMAVYMHTGSSTQCYTSYPGMYYQLDSTQDALVLSYDLTASSSINLLNILMPSYLNTETGAFTDLPLAMSFAGGTFTVTWDGETVLTKESYVTTNVAKHIKIAVFANPVAGGKEVGFGLYVNNEYLCGGTKLVSSFPGFNAIRIWHALAKNSKYTLSDLEVRALDVEAVGVYNLDEAAVVEGYVIDKLYADPLHTVETDAATGYAFAVWKEDNSFLKRFDFSGDTSGALASGWALAYGPDVWDYEAMPLPLFATDDEVKAASSGMTLSYADDSMHIYYKQNSVSDKYPVGMYYPLEDTYASLAVSSNIYASSTGKLGQPLTPTYFDAETGTFTALPLSLHLYAGELTVTWNGEVLAENVAVPTSNSTPVNFKVRAFATAEEIGFALYINGECKYTGTAVNDLGIEGFNAVRMNILSKYNCSFTIDDIKLSTDVARIGTSFYASAAAAAKAAQAGDVLELLADSNDVINVNVNMTINMNGHNLAGAVIADGATLTGIDSANNDYSEAGVIAKVTGAVAANAAANGRTYLAIADGNAYSFHRYYLKTSAVGLNANYEADGMMQPALFYQYALAGDQAVLDAVDGVGVAYWIDESADSVMAQTALPETLAAGKMGAKAGQLYTGKSAMVYGLLQEGQDAANVENIQKTVLGRAYIRVGDTVIYSDNCMGNTMKNYIETADAMWDTLILSQRNALSAMYQAFPELMNLLALSNNGKDTASAVSLLKETLAEEAAYTAAQTGGYVNSENKVVNGDFENGTAGWERYQTSVYSAKTIDGNQVLSLGRTGTVDNPFVSRELDLAPGSRCDISFRYYIQSAEGAAVPCVYISCLDASGREIETVGVWGTTIVTGQWATVSGQVDLPENAAKFRARVRVRTTADAEVYFDDVVITPQRVALDTEDMFFYTDRQNDTASFTAKVYDSDLSAKITTVTFAVFNADQQIWSSAAVNVTNGQAVQAFALSNLTELEVPYTVVATAKDAAGNVIYVKTQNIYMYYRPANMAADGTFLSDGEAFYPVFGYGVSSEQIASKNITLENAINVARLGTYSTSEGAIKALDALQKKGMKGMICLHPGMRAAGSERNMDQTIAVIGDPRVYNHPALFGYCIMDEAFLNYSEGDPLKDLENTYRLIRMFDNMHPILATENMPEHFDEVAQRLNCLILDQYSTAASQEVYNEAAAASAVTDKPVYALTQSYNKDGVWPTADDLRNNNYQYLLGGCTGLGYYRLSNAGGSGKDIWDTAEDGGNPDIWNAMQTFFTAEFDILMAHFGNTDVDAINQKLVKTDNYWYYTFQANGNEYAVVLGMMDSGAAAEAAVNGSFAGSTVTVIAGTDAAGTVENGTLKIAVTGVEAILCQIN